MARIYKGSRYTLQLLVCKNMNLPIEDVRFDFFTTNPETPVEVTDNITINGNIANVVISSTQFDTLDDGLICYRVYGTRNNVPFMDERQSNYFLKSNADMGENGDACKMQEKTITYIGDNGEDFYIITPDQGYDGLSKVSIGRDVYRMSGHVFALEDLVGYNFALNGELMSEFLDVYISEHDGSAEGFFDNTDMVQDFLMNGEYDKDDYDKCLMHFDIRHDCVDISNMYTGNSCIPILELSIDGTNIKRCENAFNGFEMLAYVSELTNLGYSFEEPQTLDISKTRLNNDFTRDFAKTMYDFNTPNKNGVSTSFIKGVNQEYQQYFTDRGWQCID